MNRRLFGPLIVLLSLVTAPLFAVPEPGPDELKANRASLAQWRKQPTQMARLQRDVQAFLALREDRRERVLKLDHDLHKEPAASRTQLMGVLERYARWLERLPATDRLAVENAADATARIVLIGELRARDWMQSQPKPVREQWDGLAGQQKTDFLTWLRAEERKRRQDWRFTVRFWKDLVDGKPLPSRFADLDKRDREGVGEYLTLMLSKQERERLRQAEGNWPAYPVTLVELADLHPLALPYQDGPRSVEELPLAVQDRFKKKFPDEFAPGKTHVFLLNPYQGKPTFPKGVATVNRQYLKDPLPRELWACNYEGLGDPMKAYVDQMTKLVLTDLEKAHLKEAEGLWPDYPLAIQKLAKDHQLPAPPWETALTGSREPWDSYRSAKLGGMQPGKRHD